MKGGPSGAEQMFGEEKSNSSPSALLSFSDSEQCHGECYSLVFCARVEGNRMAE